MKEARHTRVARIAEGAPHQIPSPPKTAIPSNPTRGQPKLVSPTKKARHNVLKKHNIMAVTRPARPRETTVAAEGPRACLADIFADSFISEATPEVPMER